MSILSIWLIFDSQNCVKGYNKIGNVYTGIRCLGIYLRLFWTPYLIDSGSDFTKASAINSS